MFLFDKKYILYLFSFYTFFAEKVQKLWIFTNIFGFE